MIKIEDYNIIEDDSGKKHFVPKCSLEDTKEHIEFLIDQEKLHNGVNLQLPSCNVFIKNKSVYFVSTHNAGDISLEDFEYLIKLYSDVL